MTTIIQNPRITEKASSLVEQNAYTFHVAESANKTEIKKAIFSIFKVRPVRVNILPIQRKTVFARGQKGAKGGGKKAVVYLKKGDEIKLV
ncbi:MAG: 50S ribosomal protein L23 [bacterium]|nr:50S ribosomal protein L23 [bacterium]